ncbi:MAG: ACT domain-containing protein [Candidatus Omnitrophota bacterium]
MSRAILDKQLIITVDNKVGTLAEVSGVISTSGINLIAVCAYAVDNKGFIMFVSENNKEAEKLLKEKGYEVREEEVILLNLDNKPGALQAVTQRVADAGIDLTFIYGSVEQKGKTSRIVLISEDNKHVLALIKTM